MVLLAPVRTLFLTYPLLRLFSVVVSISVSISVSLSILRVVLSLKLARYSVKVMSAERDYQKSIFTSATKVRVATED